MNRLTRSAEEIRRENVRLHRLIKRYETALRFYANTNHYANDGWGVPAVICEYADAGRRARSALGKKRTTARRIGAP